MALNAEVNGVAIGWEGRDLVGDMALDADIVLAGDVFYDRAMSAAAGAMVFGARQQAASSCSSAIPAGPTCRARICRCSASYEVPVTRALEDSEVKKTSVWRFA